MYGLETAQVMVVAGGSADECVREVRAERPLDEYCERGDLPDGREGRCEARAVKDYTRREAAAA